MNRFDLTPQRMLVVRELAFVAVVLGLLLLPVFVTVGAASWVAIGALLAFALVHPRSLILAVPGAIAMSFRPFPVGDMHFNVLEILVASAAAGYTPRVAGLTWRNRGDFKYWVRESRSALAPDKLSLILAGLILIAGIVSVFWMADSTYAAESLRTFRWTIAVPLVWFLMATAVLKGSLDQELTAGLFVAGAVLSSAIALVDGVVGGGVEADAVSRLAGIAPHPNALALVLERTAVVGVLVGLLYREKISAYWLGSGMFVTLVTLLTFSRGAVLGMLAGILIVLLLTRATKLAAAAAGGASFVIGAMSLLAPERTLSLLGGGSGSLRLELWRSSLEMIRDHPVTGVGLDQFLYQYLPRYVTPEAWPERFTSHPHNVLLDAWLSLGIIGLVVIGVMGYAWVRYVRAALRVRDRMTLAAAGALVAVFVHGFVDQAYFLPELAMSTWLLILLLRPQSDSVLTASRAQGEPEG